MAGDDRDHPLHRVYRKRMRGVRVRWLTSGWVLGLVSGIALTLIVSAVVVTQVPEVAQSIAGDPDVVVVIGEGYLNRVAAERMNGSYATGVEGLTLTALHMDLKPDNRMDLQTGFNINAFFTSLNTTAGVKNRIAVENGQLAVHMIGDPQLGNLNVSLDALPFNLKDRIAGAVDKVNNDLIISEINKSLQSSFGGSDFAIVGISTDENGLNIRLKQR